MRFQLTSAPAVPSDCYGAAPPSLKGRLQTQRRNYLNSVEISDEPVSSTDARPALRGRLRKP